MSTGSHFESEFLHNPIVYGVACLLYGVATSDSVLSVCAYPSFGMTLDTNILEFDSYLTLI